MKAQVLPLIKLLFALSLVGPPLCTFAASFDCHKAATSTEKMICSDAQTSALDSKLQQTYKTALAAASNATDKKALTKEQRNWITYTRGSCQDAACLRQVYTDRIIVLTRNEKSMAGTWELIWPCDHATAGSYAQRCDEGERDSFTLKIVVNAGKLCALHAATAYLGNKVDEDEGPPASITGHVNGANATVKFVSNWGGKGAATLTLKGNTLEWKIVSVDQGQNWLPDQAVLKRVPDTDWGRTLKCPM